MRARGARGVIAFLVGFVALAGLARAASVTPSERVKDSVTVRAAPSAASATVGTLRVGEAAELLDEVPRWLKVRLSNGTEGFVSKAWTTVVEAGSTPPTPPTPTSGGTPPPTPAPGTGGIAFRPVFEAAKLSTTPPAAGAYRVHLIDVGTGLS